MDSEERRALILGLAERVADTFPEDWSPGFTVRDIVRLWLIAEADQ